MCGRFSLHHPTDEIHDRFAIQTVLFTPPPRYNVAPTQAVAVITPARELVQAKWGLVPSWSRDGRPFINARSEGCAEKPAFRDAFRRRRVLVPADGFYEWRAEGKAKLPYHIRLRGGALFAMAGIAEPARDGGPPTVAVLTVAPNELVAAVHDRMPVILRPEDEAAWLDPDNRDPSPLCRTYPAEAMEMFPVSTRVNTFREDDPGLLEPA